jgi:hypothetical protein
MVSAVLTADIVNSTRLSRPAERKLLRAIESVLKLYQYEFYRGDSFQVYMKEADKAMRTALLLRSAARRIDGGFDLPFDVRISIGLGRVQSPVKNLATTRAEPFILSGRAFDEISQSEKKMMITCGKAPFDIALETLAEYADEVFSNMTTKQAAIIFELLSGVRQKDIAKKFKKSHPTINKQVQAAGWSRVESILNKFDRIVKLLSA